MDDGITFTPNENLWEAGVKIISDGSPHCGTAAVREPFLNSNLTQTLGFPPAPCYGQLNYSSEELLETVKFFHQQGTQIAVHAHGERAIDQVISVYEQVRTCLCYLKIINVAKQQTNNIFVQFTLISEC